MQISKMEEMEKCVFKAATFDTTNLVFNLPTKKERLQSDKPVFCVNKTVGQFPKLHEEPVPKKKEKLKMVIKKVERLKDMDDKFECKAKINCLSLEFGDKKKKRKRKSKKANTLFKEESLAADQAEPEVREAELEAKGAYGNTTKLLMQLKELNKVDFIQGADKITELKEKTKLKMDEYYKTVKKEEKLVKKPAPVTLKMRSKSIKEHFKVPKVKKMEKVNQQEREMVMLSTGFRPGVVLKAYKGKMIK